MILSFMFVVFSFQELRGFQLSSRFLFYFELLVSPLSMNILLKSESNLDSNFEEL